MNFVSWSDGGTNPASRFAAARAMSRHGTFSIDRYQYWTVDRAQAPDGRYFSNKAPGAAMFAAPVSWILDHVGFPTNDESRGGRPRATLAYKTAVCFLVQAVPFAILVLVLAAFLVGRGIPTAAVHYFALAALFGNTAALFVNVFFGHVVTAWLLLAVALAALHRSAFGLGLAFGFALLSDYAVAALVVPFAGVVAWEGRTQVPWRRWVLGVGAGGLLPALLWIVYHTASFGGPFTTALHHQNPMFTDPEQAPGTLRAVLSPVARGEIVAALVAGPSRGILVTQPWVLAVYGLAVLALARRRRDLPPVLLGLLLPGLPLLVWLNAGFQGWHGGWSAGPRYLSPLFPLFALAAAFLYKDAGRGLRWLLWAGLAVSLVLRGLVFASGSPLFRGLGPIWEAYGREWLAGWDSMPGARLLAFVSLFLLAAAWVWKRPAPGGAASPATSSPPLS